MTEARGRYIVAALLAGLALASPPARALNPALDISQYAHTSWKVRDGFVKGVINSITQAPDGYLWLGTEFGLVRFDGVNRILWQPPEGQRLPSTRIYSLLAARDGALWIGSSKGLSSWRDGKLTEYPALAGQAVHAPIIEDRQGVIWVGTLSPTPGGKLCAIRKGATQCFRTGEFDNGVSGLYQDLAGNLWVGVSSGLSLWNANPPRFYSAPCPAANGGGIQGFVEDRNGALLFGSRTGITRLAGDHTAPFTLPRAVRQLIALHLLRDTDSSLWIGTADRGLAHVHGAKTDRFAQADGLSGDYITALFIDREGTVWVATDGGLDRFREFAVPTLSLNQGLRNASVLSVLADRDGSVWLSTRRGLNRWQNGAITVFGRDGLLDGNYADPCSRTAAGESGFPRSERSVIWRTGGLFPQKPCPAAPSMRCARTARAIFGPTNRLG